MACFAWTIATVIWFYINCSVYQPITAIMTVNGHSIGGNQQKNDNYNMTDPFKHVCKDIDIFINEENYFLLYEKWFFNCSPDKQVHKKLPR